MVVDAVVDVVAVDDVVAGAVVAIVNDFVHVVVDVAVDEVAVAIGVLITVKHVLLQPCLHLKHCPLTIFVGWCRRRRRRHQPAKMVQRQCFKYKNAHKTRRLCSDRNDKSTTRRSTTIYTATTSTTSSTTATTSSTSTSTVTIKRHQQ